MKKWEVFCERKNGTCKTVVFETKEDAEKFCKSNNHTWKDYSLYPVIEVQEDD